MSVDRILIADDEKEMVNALKVLLQHQNYSVDGVYDGQSALEYIRSGIYDAVILDIMMPKIDGITVLKTIRKEKITTPILLLSAKGQMEDRVVGLDSGADDYLVKPFFMKELLARIRALTRRKPLLNDSVLEFRDLKLDRYNLVLSCKDKEIALNNKEFQILEMLMESSQAIGIEYFMEKIWGYDSDSDYNVVWVNISNLRRKLASVGSDVSIKSLRNIGYLLEEKK